MERKKKVEEAEERENNKGQNIETEAREPSAREQAS